LIATETGVVHPQGTGGEEASVKVRKTAKSLMVETGEKG